MLDFGNTKFTHDLDVVNLDRWDLLLGSPFCNRARRRTRLRNRTIRLGNTVTKCALARRRSRNTKGEQDCPPAHNQQMTRGWRHHVAKAKGDTSSS